MKSKHQRVLEAIFAVPTRGSIVFSDVEALIIALGGNSREGSGSRVVLELSRHAPPSGAWYHET
jgi:hypothetical protein